MSVFRIAKTKNYTVMSNYHLRDKNLSLKSKGLLSLMLSLPEEWDYSIGGLCSIVKENQSAIKTALKELKVNGYLTVTKLNPNETESGRIEWIYDIYETPQKTDDLDTDSDDVRTGNSAETDKAAQHESFESDESEPIKKQQVENHPVENRPQINIDIINKDNQNTDEKITECMFADRRTDFHLSVRKFFDVNHLQGDVDKFIDYYLYMPDDEFERKFRYLAKRWSKNEFVDLPIRMYDDEYRDAVLSSLPSDLVYKIRSELDESDTMQIRFGTFERLMEYLNDDGFGLMSM